MLWLAWLGLGSAFPQDSYPVEHLERVSLLMQEPHEFDTRWRNTLYQSLTRLEHAPSLRILPAWEILAQNGGDIGQANLILFCRRHELPLPDVVISESASSHLERCLALWGEGQHLACQNSLQRGAADFPSDSRFSTNLDWLMMRFPAQLQADCSSRELAQAVLAARLARP